MKYSHCKIINDLLPLYIENICSEDSKSFVEEHLAHCKDCRQTCQLLKHSELIVKTSEAREINATKKLRQYFAGKLFLSYSLFLAATIFGGLILLFYAAHISTRIYLFLMPLVMLVTYFTFRDDQSIHTVTKPGRLLLILPNILLLYSIFIMFFAVFSLQRGNSLFGLPLVQTGPFLAAQFRLLIIASLFLFVFYLYRIGTGKEHYHPAINAAILCVFLSLTYLSMLHTITTLEYLLSILLQHTIVLCVISLVIFLLLWGLLKKSTSK